jgi:hypothetical protein
VHFTFAHAEDRLELVLHQIREVEAARDAALKKPAPADEAERMIRSLVDMWAIGSELATIMVREAKEFIAAEIANVPMISGDA